MHYIVGFFVGAVIGCFVVTAILYLCTPGRWNRYSRATFVHTTSLVIAVILSAYGSRDSGELNFSHAGFYVFAQIMLYMADLVRLRGKPPQIEAGTKSPRR